MEQVRPLWQISLELERASVDQLRQRVLGGDLNSETLRVLADKQDKANNDLMYACREGDTDAVRRLLEEGADIGKIREVKDTHLMAGVSRLSDSRPCSWPVRTAGSKSRAFSSTTTARRRSRPGPLLWADSAERCYSMQRC